MVVFSPGASKLEPFLIFHLPRVSSLLRKNVKILHRRIICEPYARSHRNLFTPIYISWGYQIDLLCTGRGPSQLCEMTAMVTKCGIDPLNMVEKCTWGREVTIKEANQLSTLSFHANFHGIRGQLLVQNSI